MTTIGVLEVKQLNSGYGETQILHNLSFNAHKGKVLALLGRNGVGKTTTLKTIMSLLKATSGVIRFQGQDLTQKAAFNIARMGIAYVPETRDIFASLTVEENLNLAARLQSEDESKNLKWTIARVLSFFPQLKGRLNNGGNQLSGGEQQMLAIARALLMNPTLLLLDEPTEGLAPIIVAQIHDKLVELKNQGLTMILVEQNLGFATSLADDIAIMGRGEIVWQGDIEQFKASPDLCQKWLGV